MKLIFLISAYLIYFQIFYTLEYKKNTQIKFRERDPDITSRIIEIESLELITKKINDLKTLKANFFIILYTDWCLYCKELMETMDLVTTYLFTKSVDFYKINCDKHKLTICSRLDFVTIVNTYPSIKVFVNGEETINIPTGRELETLLEYTDKILSESVIEIKSNKEKINFSKNYGEVSFMLVDEDTSSIPYKCLLSIADSPLYKPLFYFAYMSKRNFRNESGINLPAIIVNIN